MICIGCMYTCHCVDKCSVCLCIRCWLQRSPCRFSRWHSHCPSYSRESTLCVPHSLLTFLMCFTPVPLTHPIPTQYDSWVCMCVVLGAISTSRLSTRMLWRLCCAWGVSASTRRARIHCRCQTDQNKHNSKMCILWPCGVLYPPRAARSCHGLCLVVLPLHLPRGAFAAASSSYSKVGACSH